MTTLNYASCPGETPKHKLPETRREPHQNVLSAHFEQNQ